MLTIIPLIAPFTMLLFALAMLINRKGSNQNHPIFRGNVSGVVGILAALASFGILANYPVVESELLGFNNLGLSIRIDALSVTILTMISILGFVILKFSANYMDGDPRKNIFLLRLATTIASVELLVLSGNLFQILVFWVITSVCMHYLLVFYRHRPQAIAAARKKFILARLGDASLVVAIAIIYAALGTGNLGEIFETIQSGEGLNESLSTATVLLVIAALLKSAQFPTHGWLIEVVETPTPVSALLHAGLLNAGPFLMVRLSFMITEFTSGAIILIIVGGITAVFASVVYLTQPSIKVSLGYSSVAHMGFSLLLCGLGVYSAAILHIVGHSFYKAHSFLSSGSVIDSVKSQAIRQPKRLGNSVLISLGIIASTGIFLFCCYLLGIDFSKDFSLMFIAAIIVMGLSQLLVQTLDTKGGFKILLQSTVFAIGVAVSFLLLEHGASTLLQSEIPTLTEPSLYAKGTALVLLSCFIFVMFIQLIAPGLRSNKLSYKMGIHLRNGLYANVLFDRLIGSLKHEKFKWANLTVQDEFKPQEEEKPGFHLHLDAKEDLLVNH